MIEITENVYGKGDARTTYDILTTNYTMTRFYLDKQHTLHVQDNMNSTEFVRVLGLLDSGYSVNQLKKNQNAEFNIVLQPERTATGWKINPDRLRTCLKYVYPWLPPEEYWRIYGDAQTYGKQECSTSYRHLKY